MFIRSRGIIPPLIFAYLLFGCGTIFATTDDLCSEALTLGDIRLYNMGFLGTLQLGQVEFRVESDLSIGGIYITRKDSGHSTNYNVSSRTFENLVLGTSSEPRFYPPEWLNLDAMSGLNIADLGCGNSPLVVNFAAAGAIAVAIDEFPSILGQTHPDLFKQGSIAAMPLEADSQDLEISTMSLFSYEFAKIANGKLAANFNHELVKQAFNDVHRTLKKGGSFIFSEVNERLVFHEYFEKNLSEKFDLEEAILPPKERQRSLMMPVRIIPRSAFRLIKK